MSNEFHARNDDVASFYQFVREHYGEDFQHIDTLTKMMSQIIENGGRFAVASWPPAGRSMLQKAWEVYQERQGAKFQRVTLEKRPFSVQTKDGPRIKNGWTMGLLGFWKGYGDDFCWSLTHLPSGFKFCDLGCDLDNAVEFGLRLASELNLDFESNEDPKRQEYFDEWTGPNVKPSDKLRELGAELHIQVDFWA